MFNVSFYNAFFQFLYVAVLKCFKGTNKKLEEMLPRYILGNNYFEKIREIYRKTSMSNSLFK